jgi:hypothetical protein
MHFPQFGQYSTFKNAHFPPPLTAAPKFVLELSIYRTNPEFRSSMYPSSTSAHQRNRQRDGVFSLATKVPVIATMANRGCVVLLGDFSNERLDLSAVGRDFGWSVDRASDLSELEEIGRSRTVIAVLIQAGTLRLSWPDAMRAIRAVASRARVIVCHKVGQTHSRAEMVDSGAFGVLLSPLTHSEVRQSLGFVWASKITPLQHVPTTAGKTSPKTSSTDGKVQRVGAA